MFYLLWILDKSLDLTVSIIRFETHTFYLWSILLEVLKDGV